MALQDYYEQFYVQAYTREPSGFPPPNDTIATWADGTAFGGLWIPDHTTQAMIAGAQGIKARGIFAMSTDTPVSDGDVVRRERDSLYIKIIGDPQQSPVQAFTQAKRFIGEVTERGEDGDAE